jgi:HTH-type transcriptional regulator/antitoxin HigA
MSAKIDDKKYRNLLGHCLPRVIETKGQHEYMLNRLEELMSDENKTPEEIELAKLIGTLIEAYENKHYAIDTSKVTPLRRLKHLMEANGHRPKDLWEVIGDKGTLSKILNGERQISKAQAKRLAVFYHASPAFFI